MNVAATGLAPLMCRNRRGDTSRGQHFRNPGLLLAALNDQRVSAARN